MKLEGAWGIAKTLVHTGNVYMAMIGVLNNTIIKPAQHYPTSSLIKDSKRCVRNLHHKYSMWLPRTDGKEIVTEDACKRTV